MGLTPTNLDSLVRRREYVEFEKTGGFNCIECGSCTYACPSFRHLTQGCRNGKAAVTAARKKAAAEKTEKEKGEKK
jgi:electron transport complex protein RnfC